MGVLVGEGGAEGPRDEISMVSPEQKVELTSDRRALVHRAVARREGDFLSWVRTLPAGAEGTFLRVAAMEVAGEIPSEKSLGLLFDIASGIGGIVSRRPLPASSRAPWKRFCFGIPRITGVSGTSGRGSARISRPRSSGRFSGRTRPRRRSSSGR